MTGNGDFESYWMRTTRSAVARCAENIESGGRSLPHLVLSSHLEAKMASWTLMLREAGFPVCVSPSNPASTIAAEADRLKTHDIKLLPRDPRSEPTIDFWRELDDFAPDIVFDDGAILIRACLERGDWPSPLSGAVEFTTSGHHGLTRGEAPKFPVLDVGLSYCKYELGNLYGTGVSALVAICMAANVYLAAKRVLVVGYGSVGRSVANAARGMGATVAVADTQVKHRARAHFDGHKVGELSDLVHDADVVVTCSGAAGSLMAPTLKQLPNDAIVANVGCFADEIDVDGFRSTSLRSERHDRQIETFHLQDGRRVHVLADAELVNLAIGRGWPVELIDLCFALSTLCFAEIWVGQLSSELQPVPAHLDEAALTMFFEAR
jgi:adenosylhomocysteinase